MYYIAIQPALESHHHNNRLAPELFFLNFGTHCI